MSSDLAKIARYVALNLLFTPSPLYPPVITPLRQPGSINLDLNTFEGWPGVAVSDQYQTPGLLVQKVSALHRIPYSYDVQKAPFEGQAVQCFAGWLANVPCFPRRPYAPYSNLFVYTGLHIQQFLDGGGEYEGLLQNYATPDELAPPYLGYADDNGIDGTQSMVFSFISPFVAGLGYGLTSTQIHEFGHHLGMSHPHDGYDPETGLDYGPEGPFFFAWSGDEVNSIMSYSDLNWDYSQFDRDNHHRFQAAAYLINGRAITRDILAKGPSWQAVKQLLAAAVFFGKARHAMRRHDYASTFDQAKLAYERVRAAAQLADVPVVASTNGWVVLPEVDDPGSAASLKAARSYSFQDKLNPASPRARR